MIGQPPSSALYKREHRWSDEGILQHRVEVIQHVADAVNPVGLRTEWRDVYVGEEIVLRYEEPVFHKETVSRPVNGERETFLEYRKHGETLEELKLRRPSLFGRSFNKKNPKEIH